MKHVSQNEQETNSIAQAFVKELSLAEPQQTHATLVLLSGDLGAGKTTFTKAIASALGVRSVVISPTFVIMKIYDLKKTHFKRLIHIDAYRLESESELLNLGWKEMLCHPENLILLEWPEKVAGILPKKNVSISFVHKKETVRSITIKVPKRKK